MEIRHTYQRQSRARVHQGGGRVRRSHCAMSPTLPGERERTKRDAQSGGLAGLLALLGGRRRAS